MLTISRKDQIRNTAAQLFRQKGYSATSMRLLAAELGIEPASLYSHIKSKEEILSHLCFALANEFFDEIQPIKNQNITPREKLQAYIQAHINVLIRNLNASGVFFQDWKFLSEPDLNRFKQLRKAYEAEFKAVISQGIESGIFKDTDSNFLVITLFSTLNMIHEWYKPDGKWNTATIAAQLSDLILSGIEIHNIHS